MKTSGEMERQAALQVAAMMAAAARTAPKTRGIDNISTLVVDDPETRGQIVGHMKQIAKNKGLPTFERDANCISASPAIVLIAVADNPAGLNCNFCGHNHCESLKETGGKCAFNAVDLGIAVGSAASVAAHFHIDNRVMYSVGRACVEMGMFGPSVTQALALPLSITGKSPFFDRK